VDFGQGLRLAGRAVRPLSRCEVSVCLPFNDDATVNDVVAGGEMRHLDVEVIALAREIE
jgi:hypothetical protein